MSLKKRERCARGNLACDWLPLALLAVVVIAGCAAQPTVTPTPLPSPTPTPAPPGPLSLVNSEVRVYLLMVRPVTTDLAILNARG